MNKKLSLLPFWDELNEKQKKDVFDNAAIRHYQKNEIIHGCKNTCLGMIYIIKGSARVCMISENGKEITLFGLNENELCVLSASCVISQITFETQIIAQQNCDILIVSSSAFQRITEENIYVKCFMYELMMKRFSSVMWTMQQILFYKFDKRLATFLLKEYERTGSRNLHLTQEQTAQQINSAREVVARMLKHFATDGLVEINRGYIFIKDIDGLRKI